MIGPLSIHLPKGRTDEKRKKRFRGGRFPQGSRSILYKI